MPIAYRQRLVLVAVAALLATLMLGRLPTEAATTCAFVINNASMTLQDDCQTDETIFVPHGLTLDGAGHTITAVDPAGGPFPRAVVENAPTATEIHVTNLIIQGDLSREGCLGGDARLRGILLDRAGGTIVNTEVHDLRRLGPGGTSGCQEGNAIEARNFGPNCETPAERVLVTISDNVVDGYQKTGILTNGGVDALITRNVVVGDGPVNYIAQNGIQVGFGATALVSANVISGNAYTPNSFYACGIIIVEAAGVDAKPQDNLFPARNEPLANEKDLCNFHRGGNYEPFGR